MIGKPGFLGKNFKNTFFFAIQSKIIAQSVDGDVKSAHCFPRTPSILVFSECWLGCTSKADDPWFYRTQKTLPSLWNTVVRKRAYKSWQMYFLCSQSLHIERNHKNQVFFLLNNSEQTSLYSQQFAVFRKGVGDRAYRKDENV